MFDYHRVTDLGLICFFLFGIETKRPLGIMATNVNVLTDMPIRHFMMRFDGILYIYVYI